MKSPFENQRKITFFLGQTDESNQDSTEDIATTLWNYRNFRTVGAVCPRKNVIFLWFSTRLQFFSWRQHVYVFRINIAISNLLSEKPETGYRYIIYLQNGDRWTDPDNGQGEVYNIM
jgi:hypothetical protein